MTGASSVVPCAADECVIRSLPREEHVAPRAEVWVLAATILGSGIASIDATAVNVALPTMQRELHATAANLQWVIEAYSLFLAALILVGGSLGDRMGRRKMYAAGMAIFTVASVSCGAAPNIGFVIVAAAGLIYLAGARGALLLVLALLASGAASYILLSRQREAMAGALFSRVRSLRARIDAGAKAEDDD